MKRRALGKGLRSLIPETPPMLRPKPEPVQTQESNGLLLLDLDRIHPNLAQPRRNFDDHALEELARSIKREGVLQPVIVRPDRDDSYELIAGERRWRAAQLAGLLKVPAIVREVGRERVLELALIENLQREDLNPIEEANAYTALINDLGLTQQEVAQRVGKQRATVANAIRLLGLPPEVQKLIQEGQLTAGHAKVLASLDNATLQVELAQRIVKGGLSVRDSESLVSRTTRSEPDPPTRVAERDPNVVAAEQTLQSAIGTKVRILQGKKGGRIELHFYSSEEMERVYELILGAVRPDRRAPGA